MEDYMEDYYKTIGTSKEAVDDKGFNAKQNADEEKDEFVKEKYLHSIKSIERRKSLVNSPEELEKLNRQIEQITFAYNQIKSAILRDIYNRKKEDEERQARHKEDDIFRRKTAYTVLDVLYESLCQRNDEENDRILKERKDRFLDYYAKMLENSKNFSDKAKIELQMKRIEESYDLIKTAKRREAYHAQLQREKEERDLQIRKMKIKKQYSHALEYEPSLISNRKDADGKSLKNKMVARREVLLEEYSYPDIANRKLRIRQTGEIGFENSLGCRSCVYEYEVKREVDGQEKRDIIYTSILDLKIDRKTGKPINPDYYDCVINKLLSEDTIEGARYNEGYIGMVNKNKEGKYDITLGDAKLKPSEKEMLAAVMIMKKREEKIKEEKGESK